MDVETSYQVQICERRGDLNWRPITINPNHVTLEEATARVQRMSHSDDMMYMWRIVCIVIIPVKWAAPI